jgi:hypothetical protein
MRTSMKNKTRLMWRWAKKSSMKMRKRSDSKIKVSLISRSPYSKDLLLLLMFTIN